jgi:hypothetical protein
MPKLDLSVKIDGLNLVIEIIKKLVKEADFKEGVSDDYKNGFYDFSNVLIGALERLNNRERNDDNA